MLPLIGQLLLGGRTVWVTMILWVLFGVLTLTGVTAIETTIAPSGEICLRATLLI